jgi:3-hydroxymyristoyl/3-hydroxydecanoyl-(acyl carrier protein) dehydratase
MEFRKSCRISAQHPALPGHFPGHPVVPGVVLLEEVLLALEESGVGWALEALPQVKFIEPLFAEQVFIIELSGDDPARLRFRCLREESTIASGILQARAG